MFDQQKRYCVLCNVYHFFVTSKDMSRCYCCETDGHLGEMKTFYGIPVCLKCDRLIHERLAGMTRLDLKNDIAPFFESIKEGIVPEKQRSLKYKIARFT